MMDMVLERLRILQTELAAIDPSRECDVADQVASMASALRDVLVSVDAAVAPRPVPQPDLRRVG